MARNTAAAGRTKDTDEGWPFIKMLLIVRKVWLKDGLDVDATACTELAGDKWPLINS